VFFAISKIENEIERGNVNEEEKNNGYRVKHRATANEIENDIVGRTVAAHKGHVVVVDQYIRNV
jgi:hypothetical protein